MAEPRGLRFENITSVEDLANDQTRWAVTAVSVTHASPADGSSIMPCCECSPFEVPAWDRLTLDPSLVTCKAAESARTEGSDA